jgi:hypothetical protein
MACSLSSSACSLALAADCARLCSIAALALDTACFSAVMHTVRSASVIEVHSCGIVADLDLRVGAASVDLKNDLRELT